MGPPWDQDRPEKLGPDSTVNCSLSSQIQVGNSVFSCFYYVYIYIYVCVCVCVFIIIQLSSQDMLWVACWISWPPWNDWDPNPVQSGQTSLATLVLSAENVERKVLVLLRWQDHEFLSGSSPPWTQLIQVLLFILFSRRDGARVSRLGHPRNMLCPTGGWWSQHKSWCWQEDWRSGIACSSGKRDRRGSANPWDDWTCSRLHGRQSTAGRSPKNGHQHWTWDDIHQILGRQSIAIMALPQNLFATRLNTKHRFKGTSYRKNHAFGHL